MSPDALALSRDLISFAQNVVVAVCATALAWHFKSPETLLAAGTVLGALVGAHSVTRGAAESARATQAATIVAVQSLRPPPPSETIHIP